PGPAVSRSESSAPDRVVRPPTRLSKANRSSGPSCVHDQPRPRPGLATRPSGSNVIGKAAPFSSRTLQVVPARGGAAPASATAADRKSTRLNSSHVKISYAVFCLKKKKTITTLASQQLHLID